MKYERGSDPHNVDIALESVVVLLGRARARRRVVDGEKICRGRSSRPQWSVRGFSLRFPSSSFWPFLAASPRRRRSSRGARNFGRRPF